MFTQSEVGTWNALPDVVVETDAIVAFKGPLTCKEWMDVGNVQAEDISLS